MVQAPKKIIELSHDEIGTLFENCPPLSRDYKNLKDMWKTSELVFWLDCKNSFVKLKIENGRVVWRRK